MAWQPTPGFVFRESHGQRSLAGNSPNSLKGSDMTEVTAYTQQIANVFGLPWWLSQKPACNTQDLAQTLGQEDLLD